MKEKVAMLVGAAALVATPALAGDGGYIVSSHDLGTIGPLDSTNNGGAPVVVDIFEDTNANDIVGWTIAFDYSEDPVSASWASDIRMVITSPLGAMWSVGGLSTPSDVDWDFQGSGSTDAGPYADNISGDDPDSAGGNTPWLGDPQPKGDWTVSFHNDWASTGAATLTMDNVTFSFLKIPGPGALAMLGLAGLAAPRRRRH